jgi:thiosulfate reductase cytochrome b subunit
MPNVPRHSVLVRLTHWINLVAFFALLVSGFAILLAHPRLYWGETGGAGSPALLELPLPLNLDQSGWGRGLHFLAAWVCVGNGLAYVCAGLVSRHFSAPMAKYEFAQRIAYLVVIFVLSPLVIVSGLAMSPAVNAVIPFATGLGGHQSARTIHFFVACVLVLFLFVHVVMVIANGFRTRMRGMITGEFAEEMKGR